MKNISSTIRSYKDEILEDVVRIVRIPSVRDPATAAAPANNGMPFGKGSAEALNYCLNLAKSMGFKVKNVDGYAGHIEYGEGEGLIGILAHCDVVPAGEGWTKPPFGGTVEGSRIYGRGTMDDKGPAISAIYCLKVLKDLKIVPKKRIRVIIGASEECGSEDMEYYFAHEEMPDLAFSPDSEYPICNREKGIMRVEFTCEPGSGASNPVLKFSAGSAPNIVPVLAEALVKSQDSAKFDEAVKQLESGSIKFAVVPGENGLTLRCLGKSAHASVPEQGANAAAYLVRLLARVYNNNAGSLLHFLDKTVGLELDGSEMGIACSDVPSGALTLNLGILNMDADLDSAVIDIRYPVTCDGGAIYKTIAQKAALYGVKAKLNSDSKPLYINENSTLITKLRHAYKTATGTDAELYSSGGGTYARELANNGVAFGAGIKPLSYYNIHAADEFLEVEDFMKHCEICLQAIYELACD